MGIPLNRNLWIDALRAFLALGVVHSHSLLYFEEDVMGFHNAIVECFAVFRVPSFFFIAGYVLCFQLSRVFNRKKDAIPLISKRFRQLIIPSVIFTLVPSVYVGIEFFSKFNTAHYFLPALFLIILCFCLLYALIFKFSRLSQCIILLAYALATTLIMRYLTYRPIEGYFHWRQALHGNLFFILGVVTSQYSRILLPILKKPIVTVSLGILYALTYSFLVLYLPESPYGGVEVLFRRIMCPILGIYFVFSLFYSISRFFKPNNFLGKLSFFLGQRSLPLYVLQDASFLIIYYFIDTDAVSYPQIVSLFAFVITAVLIVIIHEIICRFKVVNKYVFGRKEPLMSFKQIFLK